MKLEYQINFARALDCDAASGLVERGWLSMWILHLEVFLSATGNGRSELRRLLSWSSYELLDGTFCQSPGLLL